MNWIQNMNRCTGPSFTDNRIADLKKRARHHYLAHRDLIADYTCGTSLAGYINPNVSRHALAFNAAMDELALLDPSAPKGRL